MRTSSFRRFGLIRPLALACGLAFAAGAAQAAPDARLLAAAQKAQPAVIEHLKEMVLIESGSTQTDGLLKMADLLEKRLHALGFKTERRKVTSGTGADILIGTLKGTGKRKIMLQGHMDTVYQPGILATQPFKVEGNRVYGPGIIDDKGGLECMLTSLQILKDAGWRDYDTLTVMVNPDEETGSAGSGEIIAALGDQHDYALSFEFTADASIVKGEPLTMGTAGIAEPKMEVKGRASHAGNAPDEGRNALYELSHQMLQTKDVAKDIPGVTLNWTNASAAGPFNQIPAKATATGDVRITKPGADKLLEAAVQQKIKSGRLIPDTETTFTLVTNRPPFVANDQGRALAAKAQAIYKEIDRELGLTPMVGGGTDAAYAARSGRAVVLESLGFGGWGAHAKDEYVAVDTIVPRLYLVTRLLTEIGKQ
jgi:glutamate carboxypeptidase